MDCCPIKRTIFLAGLKKNKLQNSFTLAQSPVIQLDTLGLLCLWNSLISEHISHICTRELQTFETFCCSSRTQSVSWTTAIKIEMADLFFFFHKCTNNFIEPWDRNSNHFWHLAKHKELVYAGVGPCERIQPHTPRGSAGPTLPSTFSLLQILATNFICSKWHKT